MLKFHTMPGHSTAWPNSHVGNQARRFVGRVYKPEDRSYPASAEPSEVSETDDDARHLARKCSRGELYAADEYTAKYCRVPFVPLERGQDGEWFPMSKKSAVKPPAPPKE